MVDSIVSVRMPFSLVQKLKTLSKKNHFMDVSEEMRTIIKIQIRKQKIKLGQIKTISEEKPKPTDYKTQNVVKEEMIRKLKQMIDQLENEE